MKKLAKLRNKTHGFTLIEIIVTIVLLGILGAFGGMILINSVRSYNHAKDNAHLIQKAHMAMMRITTELSRIEGKKATSIPFDTEVKIKTCDNLDIIFKQVGNQIHLNNNVLTDMVTNFKINEDEVGNNYYYSIEIELTGANGVPVTFSTGITPEPC